MNSDCEKIIQKKQSELDEIKRNIYLRKLSIGELQGPLTGYASIDKPWLKNYSEQTILESLPEDTIYSYLKKRNAYEPERVAIEYFGNKITYKELIENIDITAKSLIALGVKKGDIVTICMPTTPEIAYLFYALSKLGAVSNMIDPRKSIKEIEEYVNEVHSKLFIGVNVISDKIKSLQENSCVDKIVIITPYESFKAPIKQLLKAKDGVYLKSNYKQKNYLNWDQFINLSKNINSILEIKYEPDLPVVIVHTGGTTGKSKGVILSNDNINNCAYQCEISGLDFSDRGVWLDIMPPFIAYGIGNGLHLPLSMGMKVIMLPKFDPTKYDEILLKHKPNYMAGVPSHYGYLLSSKKLDNVDLSFIKTPIVGGDKMDYTLEKEVNKFLKDHNCSSKIIKGYGMSEVDAAVSVCINNNVNKLKSVGIPLSHSNIGVFDSETGKELYYNEHGEIRITGPNVMLGYYNNPVEEEKILHEDYLGKRWIYSGDSGYFDKDGNLFVDGRYKEMIIRPDGFKVYPNSIEDVILMHPAVSVCKVVGCRDFRESQGELPKAFIVLKQNIINQDIVLKEIITLCEQNLAEYSLPYDYEIKDSLPTTPIGKIDTIALKKEIENKIKVKKLVK